jgi:c(7)-type cytochrome triheme protein
MQKLILLIAATLFLCSGVALAVPAGKTLEFSEGPMGVVKFDGTLHKEAGNVCKDCHNAEMFPKMKQGTVAITMDQIYAGKLCGVCHNGNRAFDAQGNCARCHIKQ